ncbi:hypothetical protein JCM6882_002956 [Rhodosporidiobolus microsporus]
MIRTNPLFRQAAESLWSPIPSASTGRRSLSALKSSFPRPVTSSASFSLPYSPVPFSSPSTAISSSSSRPSPRLLSPPTRHYSSVSSTPSPTVSPLIPFRTHLSPSPSTPLAHTFFHPPTSTWTYVVVHLSSRSCLIIDSTLDFDPATSTVSTRTADALLAFIREKGYTVERILETHAHADHLTAAAYLKGRLADEARPEGPPVGMSKGIRQTQAHFAAVYDVPPEELDGAFGELYEEGDEIVLGRADGEGIKGKVLSLPGHTACSAAFQFGDYVFVGDTIFLPTLGSARADFPAGSAPSLYTSSQRLLSLPPRTRLFSGHHYPSKPEENVCSATVAEQKEYNKHFGGGKGEGEFVKMREERDRGLNEPGLLHQSLQVNIRGGRLPRGKDGKPYFRLPIKAPDGL